MPENENGAPGANEEEVLKAETGNSEEIVAQILDDDAKKRFQTIDAQKRIWKQKAEAAEKRAQDAEEKLNNPGNSAAAAPTAVTPQPASAPQPVTLTVNDFIDLKGKGLSESEIAQVVSQAEKLKVPFHDFVQSDLFTPWIADKRAKAQAERNTPSPSYGSSPVIAGKTWDKMNDAERSANFPAYMESLRRKNTSE